jgi:hypothetical protein
MPKRPLTSSILAIGLAVLGCDEPKQEAVQVEAEAAAEASASLQVHNQIAADDLPLEAIVELIEREDVRDAESLEALINAEDSPIQIDLDNDGKRDFIQVHEVVVAADARAQVDADAKLEVEATVDVDADGEPALVIDGKDGQKVRFELRVVPSSKVEIEADAPEVVIETTTKVETVVVATVDLELHEAEREVVIEAHYAPTIVVVAEPHVVVERSYVHRVELVHRHDHLVVVGAPFVAWVWIGHRPIYVGHIHLPPGHAKKRGLYWHHGRGHYKYKHKHGHPGHGGKTHVKVKGGSGGPSKVHVKSSGGGSKVHVKSSGGGGKVHVKSGGGGKGGKGKGK